MVQQQNKFVILNVCRFNHAAQQYKGIDAYISFAKQLSCTIRGIDFVFVLCGKGTDDESEQLRQLGLFVIQNASDSEMFDVYAAADAYANFSKWEGYNLGVAQALAMGLPVIASDIPAHRAFEIFVANDAKSAVESLKPTIFERPTRKSRIYGWDKSRLQLLAEIRNAVVNET